MPLTCSVSKVVWAVVTVILRIDDFTLASPEMFSMVVFLVYDRLSREMTSSSTVLHGLRYELAVRLR